MLTSLYVVGGSTHDHLTQSLIYTANKLDLVTPVVVSRNFCYVQYHPWLKLCEILLKMNENNFSSLLYHLQDYGMRDQKT